jgi:cytohesin
VWIISLLCVSVKIMPRSVLAILVVLFTHLVHSLLGEVFITHKGERAACVKMTMTSRDFLVPVAVAVACVGVAGTAWAISRRLRRRGRPVAVAAVHPVIRAVLASDGDAIRKAITASTDEWYNAVDGEGNTALMLAATRTATAVKLIIGATPDAAKSAALGRANGQGYSAIHVACIAGRDGSTVDAVGALVDAGVSVRCAAERNKWQPLHIAAAQGDMPLTEVLLARGADVNCADVVGHTPLILASNNGHEAVVARLLGAGANVATQTSNTLETALLMACRNGHVGIARRLLEHPGGGLDAAALDSLTGATALHAAAACADEKAAVELVRILLGTGMDPDPLRRDAYTPLHLAAIRGSIPVIEALLAKGANVQLPTRFGTTALHEAAFQCHTAAVELLLSRRADPNSRDKDGETPLHRASNSLKGAAIEVMTALLDAGADPNARDEG